MLVHNHLSKLLTNQFQMVKKEFSLPLEMIEEIFKFLNQKDCCNTARVNRCFRKLSLENSNYLYNLECKLLDLCIDRGIRQKRFITATDYSSESISRELKDAKLHTEEIKKVKEDDSAPKLLLSGMFECKAKTGDLSRRKMIEFKVFNSGKIVFKDPVNHLSNHEFRISEKFPNCTEIYTAQQIQSILCLKCECDHRASHKLSLFLDLNKFINYLIFPSKVDVIEQFCRVPFVESASNFLVIQETWVRIIDQSHMIIYGKNQLHLFKLNQNMLFEGIWSYSPKTVFYFEIDLDRLHMNDKILLFTGIIDNEEHGLHLISIFDRKRTTYYAPRDFSLISLHNKIAIIKESANELLFFHKFNYDIVNYGEFIKAPVRLIVNGEIKDVRINYSSDQLVVKVIYQKAATLFKRSKLKELTLSSKNLKPILPPGESKSWLKLGCS